MSFKSVIKFWRGKTWPLYFSLFALKSSQERWSTSTTQENTPLPGSPEHIWNASLLRVYFQGSDKSMGKKSIRGKSVNFSNISVHVQRANSLEFLLPRLKLETLTTAILTWQTKPNSPHLQLHVSDVNSCGRRVSLSSGFHPETTVCKWRENHCWIKGNPCHRDEAHNFN